MPRCGASLTIAIGTRTFTLTTRADRIEQLRDGCYAILDYKTGSTPTEKQVRTGLSPQLTLEGAILRQGGFKDVRRRIAQRVRLCGAARRRAGGRRKTDRVQGRHARRARRPGARDAARASSTRFADVQTRRIARWSARCGRRATATTTIWRASRNGRPAARTRKAGMTEIPADVLDVQRVASDPAAVGLGRGQCRLGQDACAGAARDPPAAARHAAGKNPLPHLHQGRRRQHGEPRVRHAREVDARCDDAALDAEIEKIEGRRPDAGAARARAAAVRAGARYAGRPEGADHPRVLHAAAAPVSVRGGRRGALRGAGGAHAAPS